MTLGQAQADLKAALSLLGIEIGDEVLALWEDRAAHRIEPIPRQALEALGVWSIRMLAEGIDADRQGRDPAPRGA